MTKREKDAAAGRGRERGRATKGGEKGTDTGQQGYEDRVGRGVEGEKDEAQ